MQFPHLSPSLAKPIAINNFRMVFNYELFCHLSAIAVNGVVSIATANYIPLNPSNSYLQEIWRKLEFYLDLQGHIQKM